MPSNQINYNNPPSPKEQEAYELYKKEMKKNPDLSASKFCRDFGISSGMLYIARRKLGELGQYKTKGKKIPVKDLTKKRKYQKRTLPQTIIVNEAAGPGEKILFAVVPVDQAQEFFKTALGGR